METKAADTPAEIKLAAALKSSFLNALPADQRAHIFELMARTIQTLDPWLATLPPHSPGASLATLSVAHRRRAVLHCRVARLDRTHEISGLGCSMT